MSPPRRSARLASASVNKASPELSSVGGCDKTPARNAPRNLDQVVSSARREPSTPLSSALKPSHNEMHPSKARPTMGEPSSALRLGFSDIPSYKDGRQGLMSTPSKIGGIPSSPFTFRHPRGAGDAALSIEAQRMMDGIRDQAAKIKADLAAQRRTGVATPSVSGRVIAKPKGRAGRFSAVHMAEFKKMDSIEGHASAWRAHNGRPTPPTRSSSKANLNATPKSHNSGVKPSPSKLRLGGTLGGRPKPGLKRTSSVANLDHPPHPTESKGPDSTRGKPFPHPSVVPQPSFKRLKQCREYDSWTARPVPRDGSSLPRPVPRSDDPSPLPKSLSDLARLATPTKSSMAHAASSRTPTISLFASPSRVNLSSLPKSTSTTTMGSMSKSAHFRRRIVSPGRFQKVKSILRGQKMDMEEAKSAIPQPAAHVSQTQTRHRTDKPLPPPPSATPRRKLASRVAFTPVSVTAAVLEHSPSPSKAQSSHARLPLEAIDVHYRGLDEVLGDPRSKKTLYPDLSPLRHLVEPRPGDGQIRTPSVPGTFTFRSDHTIKFGDVSPSGFGASPGQSSIRHVRGYGTPTMDPPSSFPVVPSPSCHPNKENRAPLPAGMLPGTAHGMVNKKRHRPSSDEEDAVREAAERAMKKRKNEHVPEGEALLAPRLIGKTPTSVVEKKNRLGRTPVKTPGRTPGRALGSASQSRKGPVLSMSRLNMLARPKKRG